MITVPFVASPVSAEITEVALNTFFALRLETEQALLAPRLRGGLLVHELAQRAALLQVHREAWRALLSKPGWTAADVVVLFAPTTDGRQAISPENRQPTSQENRVPEVTS